ncbi:ABC transporter permease [Eoetvoesiella caeni]|uniref:Peptide/nickel transport system permease protein n=1 Tax=Eoetvoesiella caeni TaxID=645616 RepID=A0A366HGQ4_9BURK|nr:ABC transporter permease [Eoetvoesiella caeni]MCI2807906.1 ABC transporter permease [Eoetvoesiella caeni]NYT54092.1 ABC transporter permease [Eoetvoesiella caeni]RBP41824.1 peptide/nickel transport system permease protein [Eoetvoesiella caeni]
MQAESVVPRNVGARRSAWQRIGTISFKTWVGLFIVLLALFAACAAPWLAPHNPNEQDLLNMLLPPMWASGGNASFPLGTDGLGQCILSRAIYGTRVAIIVAVSAATGAMLVGVLMAMLAGYFGGWVDRIIGYVVDLWMSFPPVVLALVLMVGLGTGVFNVILAIVLVDWTRFCRVVRSDVIVVRRRQYVVAARLLGFGHLKTMLSEILPAVAPLIITLFTLEMGVAVIVEAILSFVGLSVPADTVAWGVMIADSRNYLHEAPWGMLTPVFCIFLMVLGCNTLGDGLRESLDPALRDRAKD